MTDFETKDSQGNTVKTSGSASDNPNHVFILVGIAFFALVIYVTHCFNYCV